MIPLVKIRRYVRYGLAAVLLLVVSASIAVAQSSQRYRPSAVDVDLGSRDLGVRYLKLGNTYRENGNYDLAQVYLKKGLDMVRNRGSRYWEAVGYEYLGLVYRDMGERSLALEYLRTAESIFRTILNPREPERSDMALRQVIDDIEFSRRPAIVDPAYRSENERLRLENQRLTDINRQLTDRVSELENRIRRIEADMSQRPSLPTTTVPEISDCRRDIESIARYRESVLISNNFTPINLESRGARTSDSRTRVFGNTVIGFLKKGESVRIEFDISGGEYAIVADGCLGKARDVDIRIINQRGIVLEKKDIRHTTSADITVADNRQQGDRTTTDNREQRPPDDKPQNQPQGNMANTMATASISADDPFRVRPAMYREPLAKLSWNAEYPGLHSFLITMYDCDADGAYFCVVIGKK